MDCVGWSSQPEMNPSLRRADPQILPGALQTQILPALLDDWGRNEPKRRIHVLIRVHRFQVFFSDFNLQPTQTAFSPTTSFAFPHNFVMFHQSFLLSFLWKWRLTKEILCNMALQAVFEQEADAKSRPSLGRDSGSVGRAISERPVCHPQTKSPKISHLLNPDNLSMVLWNILRQKNTLFTIAFMIIPGRQFQLLPPSCQGTGCVWGI